MRGDFYFAVEDFAFERIVTGRCSGMVAAVIEPP
jgi:hypothetical protein